MNSIKTLLAELKLLGINCYVQQGKLKTKSGKNAITPTIAEQIKANKVAIIDHLVHGGESIMPLSDELRQGSLAVSHAQKRLWFVDSLEQQSLHYHNNVAFEFRGLLDENALEVALNQLVARHEILRTVYQFEKGEVRQRIVAGRELKLGLFDLSLVSTSLQPTEIEKIILVQTQRPFDLANDLMIRCVLIKISATVHTLLIVQHHISSDGRSADILVHELGSLYWSQVNGTESMLSPLTIQYADYAAWQQTTQAEQQSELDFWQQQLVELPQVHSLNLSAARPVNRSFDGATCKNILSEKLCQDVSKLSAQLSVTPYMLMHSVFVALLARYSNQQDIIIGTPVSGRNNKHCRDIIGLFVNSVVLRSNVTPAITFDALVAQGKLVVGNALSHANAPFDKVVEVVNPERSNSHEPLFQIQFLYENVDNRVLSFPGLTITPLESEICVTRFDLELGVIEKDGQLEIVWTYNINLFNADVIEGMAAHFETLLNGVIEEPRLPVSAYPLLDQMQMDIVCKQWNETTQGYKVEKTLHGLFIDSVIRKPDAVAVIDQQGELSYLALFEQVTVLAEKLTLLSIVKEELVAVRVEKGRRQVIATLAVMMLGGAYLPVERSWPDGRCSGVFEQANCRILISDQSEEQFEQITDLVDISVLPTAHTSRDNLIKFANEWQECVELDQLAYVIFTSGSTGKPKGVAIEHYSAVNTIMDINDKFEIDANDAILVVSALSFDLSVYDIFGLLACGGRVVFPAHELAKEPSHWLDCVERYNISIWDTVPTSAAMLAEQLVGQQRVCKVHIRHILMSGDWVPPLLPPLLNRQFTNVKVHSLGGATEGSIWSIHYPITEDTSDWKSIPYGKPLSGQKFYILNESLMPCPIGVDGELYISGCGVARSYYNAPELTEERFITHLLTNERLYRTGDLGHYREDGNIIFVGRVDHQVKIRGFRIELGEIQEQLKKLTSVENAIVKINGSGELARVVAYIQQNIDCGLFGKPQKEIFEHISSELALVLADYMLPSAFILLEMIPLTSNGKVDYKALPEIDAALLHKTVYIAPVTELEKSLCAIFVEVLECDQIGLEDNFFDCGGHSLLASRIISQVRIKVDQDIPLRALFENPSVGQFSRYLEIQTQQSQRPVLSIAPAGEALQLSFAQQRMWFDEQIEVGNCKYNMAAAFELSGPIDLIILGKAFDAVIDRHQVLRSVYRQQDGLVSMVLQQPQPIALVVEDISAMTTDEQPQKLKEIASAHVMTPFDLSTDLMLAVKVVKMASDVHVLLVRLHHIAADGLSIAILTEEVCRHYQSPDIMSPLPLQYSDYASWQRRWLTEQNVAQQMEYWKGILEGIPMLHSLPLSKVRPARQSFQGTSLYFELPKELFEQVKKVAKSENVTLFVYLQTAFATLVSLYSNHNDIVIGTPSNSRDEQSLQGMIGLFLNLLLIRTDVQSQTVFTELLQRNNQNILNAFDYQHLPFEHLIEALKPQRSLSHNPLCQIKFVLQNYQVGELVIPGINVKPLMLDNEVTRFDLDLTAMEDGDKLLLEWTFKNDIFDEAFISTMAESFNHMLEQLVVEPQLLVADIQLATVAKQGLGKTDLTDRQHSLIGLIEKRAVQDSQAIALCDEQIEVSYGKLAERVNRLAIGLWQMDIGKGENVAILGYRSAEVVTAMLGVMRSGATYIPIEPSIGHSRISDIIKDADINVMLLHSDFADHGDFSCLDTFLIDDCLSCDDWFGEFAGMANDAEYPQGTDSAYIIYTSGSTGKPKGVVISHSALTDYCVYARDNYYQVDGTTQLVGSFVVTSHGFDISIPSLFVPLLVGGKVELATQGREIEQLASLLRERSKPSLIRLTPMHLVALNSLLGETEVSQCQHVFVIGGEQLHFDSVNKLKCALPQACVYNHYGPSETVVGCSIYALSNDCSSQTGVVPIGMPMDNTQCLIMDKRGNPVAEGASGELWVGGLCVGLGYLNQVELSAEKFVDLIGKYTGKQRFYKTGDIVKRLCNGNMVYQSRLDNQVSIDGFRIELSDIQTHVLAHPQVKNAVVSVMEVHNRRRLVVHVVSKDPDEILSESMLIENLRSRLPQYMLPWAVVKLDEIPTIANGKVDFNALVLPDQRQDTTIKVAPANELQHQLCEIFAEVLHVPVVGIEDNFFALGGDSIIAIQAIAKGLKAGVKFNLQDLFVYPTVQMLSTVVTDSSESHITASRSFGEIPLLPIQADFFEQNKPNAHHYNQSLLLDIPAQLDFVQLEQIFKVQVNIHDSLRQYVGSQGKMVFVEDENQLLADALSTHDLSGYSPQQQQTQLAQVIETLQTSFDVSCAPLFKVCLFDYGNEPGRLFIVMHHLLIDGVSWRILLDDLNTLYEQILTSQPLSVMPQSMSLQQWSNKVQEFAKSGELAGQQTYWVEQLTTEVDTWPQSVCCDDENRAVIPFTLSFSLDSSTSKQLAGSANEAYNTNIEELMLAALGQGLKAWSGQSIFRINLESHGRVELDDEVDLSRLVGWLTAFYPFIIDTSDITNLAESIKWVKENYRQVPNKGFGFRLLTSVVKDNELCLLQNKASKHTVEFNYLGQFDSSFAEGNAFSVATEDRGHDSCSTQTQRSPVYVNGLLHNGQLNVSLKFDPQVIDTQAALDLADGYQQQLIALVQHCMIVNELKKQQIRNAPQIDVVTRGTEQEVREFSI